MKCDFEAHVSCLVISEKELRCLYPKPLELLETVFTTLSGNIDDHVQLTVSPHLSHHMWVALATTEWPLNIQVEALRPNREQSIECAHLLMCEQMKYYGLVIKKSSTLQSWTPENVKRIIEAIDMLPSIFKSNLRIETHPKEDAKSTWETNLSMEWPVPLFIRAEASSAKMSEVLAFLRTEKIFKKNGLSWTDKGIKFERRRYLKTHREYFPKDFEDPNCSDFSPDFEVFTDASTKGFGAFLLNQNHHKVRWISEQWDDYTAKEFTIHDDDEKHQTNIMEFYTIVSSIYTWKEKFANKKVLLWSDNQYALKLLELASKNPGAFYISLRRKTCRKNTDYYKLFQILLYTLSRWNITVQIGYVPRSLNKADLLAKDKLDEFRKEFPNAFATSKKVKKLKFWIPLCGAPNTSDVVQMNSIDPFNMKKQDNPDLIFTQDPPLVYL
ncbi:hypothetical protein FSP39_023954 [Pinctada imbricata]|uniref:Reverse transcriptase RNase H-like domain-containing protein n=1 Tax=Pinctada imbricata TaxID=66713 RepID=A0AA89CBM0_PINIB|nr:hypothetical protein FSP39_023954 [Pinctada imbricata]